MTISLLEQKLLEEIDFSIPLLRLSENP